MGDASIASPFTSKTPSIAAVVHLVRQGRCTLVTTLQMFKILALNCLVQAYMLSFLSLSGVKQGDQQMTVFGLFIAACFLWISRAQPLEKLSPQRPRAKVFCIPVMLSLMLQFAVHLTCLVAAVSATQVFIDKVDPAMEPDGDFKPNVINTVVFLLSSTMQINTFAANYHGHPFMQSMRENKFMYNTLAAGYVSIFLCVTEVFPPLNDCFELVPLPA